MSARRCVLDDDYAPRPLNGSTSVERLRSPLVDGLSKVFRRPDFQDDVERVVGDARGTPDISLSAAVDDGVIVYYSFVRPQSPWLIFGGTSESSPLFAGVVAIADQAADTGSHALRQDKSQ